LEVKVKINKNNQSFGFAFLPIVDCAFILLFIFMTAYTISADNVPPPINLSVNEYFDLGEIKPKNKDTLINKIIQEIDKNNDVGTIGKLVVTGHASAHPTNKKDKLIFKKGRKTPLNEHASNFDYSYLRARLVHNYIDSLNKEKKWSYLEDAKIIISAAGSEDPSNETDPLADENRRITIEFKRK